MSENELDDFLKELKKAMMRNPDLDAISVLNYVINRKNPTRLMNTAYYLRKSQESWKINNLMLNDALKHYNK